jgi:seryl-tRNA synthetase
MINIKLLRENFEVVKHKLLNRGVVYDLRELLDLDTKIKHLKTVTQALQAERNKISKDIGLLKNKDSDIEKIDNLMDKVAKTKQDEQDMEKEIKQIEKELHDRLLLIPNIYLDDVPVGKSEFDNIEIRKYLEPKTFNFKPKEHYILAENMMDFKTASLVAGARFVYLKGDLARLERALANFMLDFLTSKRNFTEMFVPLLVNDESLIGTGQLPKFKDDMFQTKDGRWLISTSEISLTNIVRGKILKEEELPIRYTALSSCFRSEAGAAGKDNHGIIRQHQFNKVEMVSIVAKDKGEEELEYLVQSAEEILKMLQIPYRVMLLCSMDMGFSAAKTYDIEVFLPGQNKYREISSCSLCTDFQARRMESKYKSKDGKINFLNTLNGSALAVGRCLVAVIENYQNEDGSINIPEVIQPYMGYIEKLEMKI